MRNPHTTHSRYLSKLQKISETSSPSKQLQSPNESTSLKNRINKINPVNLTSTYLKFKRIQDKRELKQDMTKSLIDKSIDTLIFQQKQYKNNEMNLLNVNKSQQFNKQTIRSQILYKQLKQSKQVKQKQTIKEKNEKINSLQQKIIRKKIQVNLIQNCFQIRNQQNNSIMFTQLFIKMFRLFMNYLTAQKGQGRKVYLKMLYKYSKERKHSHENAIKIVIETVLGFVKEYLMRVSYLVKKKWGNV